MNVRMIASIFLFVGLMIGGMAAGQEEPMAAILPFVDIPSILIVVGVVISGTIWSFPIEKIQEACWDACSIGQVDEERGKRGYLIFQSMAGYSIGGGILGTIIGLVKMLANLDDPTAIGPAMAVALLTIFYGVLLGEVVFKSMANSCLSKSSSGLTREEHRGFVTLYAALFSIFVLISCFMTMMLAFASFD